MLRISKMPIFEYKNRASAPPSMNNRKQKSVGVGCNLHCTIISDPVTDSTCFSNIASLIARMVVPVGRPRDSDRGCGKPAHACGTIIGVPVTVA